MPRFELEAVDMIPIFGIEMVVVQNQTQSGCLLVNLLLAPAASAPVG